MGHVDTLHTRTFLHTMNGIVTLKITDELIIETKHAALSATGEEKISLMSRLQIYLAHRGKYVVHTQKSAEEDLDA